MKRLNIKVVFAAFAAMLVMCVTVAVLSFALADENAPGTDVPAATAEAAETGTKTNIDYIILNSLSTEAEADTTYHIVEIGSSAKHSYLDQMVTEEKFRTLVINGNRTIDEEMPEKKIEYQYFGTPEMNASEAKCEQALLALKRADFVYVSNDPENQYSTNNDFPQDIMTELANAVSARKIPFMIDSPAATQDLTKKTTKTFTLLADDVFSLYGASRYTFPWKKVNGAYDPANAADYFSRTSANSLYIPIHGNTTRANWEQVADNGEVKTIARILTIKNTEDDHAITDMVLENVDQPYTPTLPEVTEEETSGTEPSETEPSETEPSEQEPSETEPSEQEPSETEPSEQEPSETEPSETEPSEQEPSEQEPSETQYDNVFVLAEDAPLRTSGYISGEAVPDCVRVESIDVSVQEQKDQLETIDYSKYDLVIIESGCKSVVIKNEVYSKLSAAMYGMVHIIYSGDLLSMNSGSGSGSSSTTAPNYATVYEKAAYTDSDTPKYSNVLITDREQIEIYYVATKPEAEADIVRIINNGSFRGIGGGDESGNKYTVLELQPCYPIDTTLATKFTTVKGEFDSKSKRNSLSQDFYDPGFYYLRTNGVLNGVTSDEISFDGTNSVTEMETNDAVGYSSISSANKDNLQDYYAWEVSKAKIAHLKDMDMDQIVVVHMSTTEFAASRESLLDNYDLIYIGGDTSSIKSAERFIQYRAGVSNAQQHNGEKDHLYRMYYHNGDSYEYPSGVYGSVDNGYGVLMGNDITQDKLEELENYISKGMPIVFEKKVAEAYDAITPENKYTADNNNIDPDSNMYKLLTYAKGASTGRPNVLWGFDASYTIKALNEGGQYGTTYNGYVTVFGGVDTTDYLGNSLEVDSDRISEKNLKDMLEVANKRPKLALTLTPVQYVEGDPDTAVTSNILKFNFDITGSSDSYSVNVYVDDDGNSRFSSEEIVASASTSKTGSISAELAEDYFGRVYWKVEVTDNASGASASATGITKIKSPDPDAKDDVFVLQILPDIKYGCGDAACLATLWLCTECQQCNAIMKGNRYCNTGKYRSGAMLGNNAGFMETNNIDLSAYAPLPTIKDSSYKYTGNSLGVHQHRFGLVKYDSNLTTDGIKGFDDWTSNWAYALEEDYNFEVSILTTREYEKLCADIIAQYKDISEDPVAVSELSKKYDDAAKDFKDYYELMQDLINGKLKASDPEYTRIHDELISLGANEQDIQEFLTVQGRLDKYLQDLKEKMQAHNQSAFGETTYDQALQEMDEEQVRHNYYDFFSLFNSKDNFDGNAKNILGIQDAYSTYCKLFAYWRNAKIYEEYFHQKYIENREYSFVTENGIPDLNSMYSIIVFGAAERFGDDDIRTDEAIKCLQQYMDNDGSVLLFHDTLTKDGKSGAKMTEAFREYFGQEARHMNGSETEPQQSELKTFQDGEYFLSTLTDKGFGATKKLSTTALTARSAVQENSNSGALSGNFGFMHKYTYYDANVHETVPVWDSQFKYADMMAAGDKMVTDRAEQNNKGIVTMYPFAIDSQLMVSATHPQAFALDIEDPDLTVWYSLAGGSIGSGSSLFAADPRNGTENYFIYTYNNVTYCGAGHSNLTGITKNNNDERRLIINVICNSVKKSAIGTNIKVYDHEAETNEEVRIDPDGNYYMKTDDMTSAPEFAYKATTDTRKGVQVANVKIYYDLGYEPGKSSAYDPNEEWEKKTDGTTTGRYVLFFNKNYPADETIGSGKFKPIDSSVADGKVTVGNITTTKLNLKPEYFAPYNNEYTYIVIAVTDTNGKVTYKRIQIRMKQKLYDLT